VLLWSSLAAMVVAFGLPFTEFGSRYFQFVPVPHEVVVLIGAILATYFLAAELVKRPFFRHFETAALGFSRLL
jgi:hypothetical protein